MSARSKARRAERRAEWQVDDRLRIGGPPVRWEECRGPHGPDVPKPVPTPKETFRRNLPRSERRRLWAESKHAWFPWVKKAPALGWLIVPVKGEGPVLVQAPRHARRAALSRAKGPTNRAVLLKQYGRPDPASQNL